MYARVSSLVLLWLTANGAARAEEPGTAFFEAKVRPILIEHCYSCHSTETKKHKGGLLLDTRAALRKGGDSGPGLVPGKPGDSLLIKAVRYTDPDLRMPPKGKLSAAALADLEQWIALGAPDPRTGSAAVVKSSGSGAGRVGWAYQPPRAHPLPAVKDTVWPRGDIDRFLLARLEGAGLKPAADAERATLLRRAYFALIGLPPSPEQIDAFLRDTRANAPAGFARVVDELLASPHFGERWGRHWLDVARYADSSGGGRSLLFKEAWRFRDYVIDAFNADRPYDHFVTEQIAGDLLAFETPQERQRQLIATAFLLLGPTNFELQDKPVLEMDLIDEQLDTIGKAFLGMTIGCARCHDHKFDPIPTSDYYALAGILKCTKVVLHDNVSRWTEQPLPMSAALERAIKVHDSAVTALKGADPKTNSAAVKRLQAQAPERPFAMAVTEAEKFEDCHICIRGNFHNKGPRSARGFLTALTPPALQKSPLLVIGASESGRRQLAAWLTSPDNPQTARVLVNRVWHHLFGVGLVRTVDNFGATGETPSHPELLDHLALGFVAEGWSVKKLIRAVMLSHAYQQTTGADADTVRRAAKVDPENRLLWHMNRHRLEAECIRDAMLAVSGSLEHTMGGPRVTKATIERDYRFEDTRRSVYTPVFRNKLLELFEVFDFANPNSCLGCRSASTVAPQALFLMNSPFVMDQARRTAAALRAAPNLDDAARLERAYRLALGRAPTQREAQLTLAFLEQAPDAAAWERVCQALFACVDFRYVN